MTLRHSTKDDRNSEPRPLEVLIVDDRRENLVALRTVLEDLDVKIIEAASGNEALSATLNHSFAVAILDVMMPEMDGYELAGYLRGDPKTAHMPIIFLTAVSTDEQRIFRGYEAGAVDYIVKPYNPDILVSKVRVFLELAAVHAQLTKHRNHLDELVQERVREQACLYGVSEALLAGLGPTPEKRLQQAVNRIPSGWRYSTIACARLETDDQTITSQAFKESPWRLSADVVVNEDARGTVEVFYTEERPDAGLGPFLQEEQALITSIALLLGQAIARAEAIAREKHLTAVLHSIRNVNQLIVREKRRDVLIESACDTLVRTRGFRGAWIVLNGDSSDQVEAAQHGFDPAAFDELTTAFRGGGLPACCKRSREEARMVATPDPAAACQGCPLAEAYAGNAALTVEFRHEDRCYGCLGVAVPPGFAEDEEEASLLLEIAGDIAFALHGMETEAERKRAEQTLQLQSKIAEHIAEGVYLIRSSDGVIVYTNPTFERMFGYDPGELIGKHASVVNGASEESPEEGASRIIQSLSETGSWSGEVYNIRKNGETFWCHANVSSFTHPEYGPVWISVHQDITEKIEMEAQLRQAQKLDAVGQLAGGVAHDFNNLLMGILNYVELCREGLETDHAIHEWLDEITNEAERSAEIVRQLLAFSRKQTIVPRVLDLSDAVANMLKMLGRLLGEDIDLLWQPGTELKSVKMDPGQVDQILANLCVNARDAIGGVGRITIETANVTLDDDYCATHAEVVPGEHVMLAVSDTGCGMDREILESIFEPFFTTKPAGEGTGLGLATVYGIVKQNEGSINVYSEPGDGTTFRIYLPCFEGVSEEAVRTEESGAIPGGDETILLVEDEKSIRVTSGLFLEDFGYTVLTAETPEEALRQVAEHPGRIHLLITDVVMPGMSGRDLAEKLVGEYPRLKCLYISGYTADVIVHRGILEEGVDFLSKPFQRDEFARKVREVLDAEK